MDSKEALKNLVKKLVRAKKKDLIKNGYNERVSLVDILSSETINEIGIIATDLGMLEILKKDRRISKPWPTEEFIKYPESDTESVSKGLLEWWETTDEQGRRKVCVHSL